MNKYIFQTGGQEDTDSGFFNQLADQFIANNQQAVDYENEQLQQPDAELEEESDFIKSLRTLEEEDAELNDAKMLESFNQKLTTMQQQMDYQLEEMQNQMAAYAALSSDDGQDYFAAMYNTNDDSVPFTIEETFPKLNSLYFNSAGQQGLNNIGEKGAEIGNTVAGMLGYKPTFNSIYRDAEQQKKYIAMGVGSPNSYHLTGNAVDMEPQDWDNLTKDQKAELKSKYDVVYHNNHYHIEPK